MKKKKMALLQERVQFAGAESLRRNLMARINTLKMI
jgi:hypothetical protein